MNNNLYKSVAPGTDVRSSGEVDVAENAPASVGADAVGAADAASNSACDVDAADVTASCSGASANSEDAASSVGAYAPEDAVGAADAGVAAAEESLSPALQRKILMLKLFPSMLTVMGLCFGVTSIKYALDANFVMSAASILAAAMFDMLDGRVARMFNVTSKFGGHFDSLSDIGSFGISSGVVMYIWGHEVCNINKGMMWFAIILYISCAALRLARFNVESLSDSGNLDTQASHCSKGEIYNKILASGYFFNGVPTTLAAILLMTPMMSTFEICDVSIFHSSWLLVVYIMFIAGLMVCRIPTFSPKRLKIEKRYLLILFLLLVTLTLLVVLETWSVIPMLAMLYIASIPVSFYRCKKLLKKLKNESALM